MDPTAALESILHGHLVTDHVEALTDWFARGGLRPQELILPVDCHVYFAAHVLRIYGEPLRRDPVPRIVRVKADAYGIWTFNEGVSDDWWCAGTWAQIAQLEDSEDY